MDNALASALATVPPGRWGVGVSGGADSVALLSLLRHRSDLSLVVIHLDHETRGGASAEDAAFVESLCGGWKVPCHVALRSAVESTMLAAALPANPSARYRAVRLEWFARISRQQALQGVMLAHHADDQAETVLFRLMRGAGSAELAGMSRRSAIGPLVLLRPLLDVRRQALRRYLREIGQAWREDESNVSPAYERNRLRRVLGAHPALVDALLEMSKASSAWADWLRSAAPALDESFEMRSLDALCPVLAEQSARQWLLARGCPPGDCSHAAVERLLQMARDAASPARQHFPGRLLVRRRGRRIFVERPSA